MNLVPNSGVLTLVVNAFVFKGFADRDAQLRCEQEKAAVTKAPLAEQATDAAPENSEDEISFGSAVEEEAADNLSAKDAPFKPFSRTQRNRFKKDKLAERHAYYLKSNTRRLVPHLVFNPRTTDDAFRERVAWDFYCSDSRCTVSQDFPAQGDGGW